MTAPRLIIRQALVDLPGVGPWTAGIFTMSCLGRAEAFAPGDRALQEAVRLVFALDARPKPGPLAALAKRWRAWHAVARSREGAPVEGGSA